MTEEPKQNRGALTFVLFAVFIDTLGFGIVMPVMPDYLAQLTGESVSDATRWSGLIMGTFALTQFLFGPLIGNLSDRFGRRPILLASMLGFAVNYLLMAMAPTLAWLFVGRACAGIAGAIFAPANAFVADITRPENRARGFGMVGASFGLGFVVGPGIGGLIGVLGPRAPFFAAAGLALANACFGFVALSESLPLERRRAFSIKRANPLGALLDIGSHRGVLAIICAIFLLMTSVLVFPSTWSFFTKLRFGWSTVTIGASLTFVGVTMAVVQGLLIGRIVRALGERRAAILGLTASTLGLCAMAFALQEWMIFAIMLVTSLQALAAPSLNALASQRTSQLAQGELQGVIASANGLGAVIGPVLFSYLLSWSTSPARAHPFAGSAFLAAALFSLTALTLAFLYSPRSNLVVTTSPTPLSDSVQNETEHDKTE